MRLHAIPLRCVLPVLVPCRTPFAGEEISFDYELNEWAMAAPFSCQCGAASCRSAIRGFSLAKPEDRPHLESRCTPLIKLQMKAER